MHLKIYISHALLISTISTNAAPLKFRRVTASPFEDHTFIAKRSESEFMRSLIKIRDTPNIIASGSSSFSTGDDAESSIDSLQNESTSASGKASSSSANEEDSKILASGKASGSSAIEKDGNILASVKASGGSAIEKDGEILAGGKASGNGAISEDGEVTAAGSYSVKMPEMFTTMKKIFNAGLNSFFGLDRVKRAASEQKTEDAGTAGAVGATDPLSGLTGILSGAGLDDVLRSLPVKRANTEQNTEGAGAAAATDPLSGLTGILSGAGLDDVLRSLPV